MAHDTNPPLVNLVERADKALERVRDDGKSEVYYPARNLWLDLQDLEVWQHLKEPSGDQVQPSLVAQARGVGRLQDNGISVIGEADGRTRTLRVCIDGTDQAPPEDAGEVNASFAFSFEKPLGSAWLGFSRADWENDFPDEWYLSCHVPWPVLNAMCESATSGTLKSVSICLRLKGLFTDEHPVAPTSKLRRLFLRPDKQGKGRDPETALGYVVHMSVAAAKVDLRPVEASEAADSEEDQRDVRPTETDPTAEAIGRLTMAVNAFRTTVRWVGGIVAACLIVLALR